MNKYFTFLLALLSFTHISNAQFLWLEDETNTHQIEYESTTSGYYCINVTNPDNTGLNTNAIVSKFNRDKGTKAFLQFDLFNYVTDLTDYSVTLKAYIDKPTDELTTSNSKLRVYFGSSDEGTLSYEQLNFTVGQEWETFTFNFKNVKIPKNILDTDGYDLMKIGFATGSIEEPAVTYYIDQINGSTDQTVIVADQPAAWLAGSWGATFPVFGGERLDAEIATGHDPLGGVQELVTELPAVGHVITNLSYFAHSHYFNVRENTNVDVATEIHKSLVPSLENQEIMLEVLQTLKDSGKKIILYISTNYLDRASDETQAAWVAYYTDNFGGDEYLAYKDLVQGFIPAIAEYADGYWFDTTTALLNDGHLEDFVQMFKEADPTAAMSVSTGSIYFQKEGVQILVDSDGVNDDNEIDYKVISFEANNTYQDFTRGHVTPLGQGAPPNSWAYEEFTIPAMVGNPWSKFEKNQVLRHGWFPVRDKWHVSTANLIFGIEDAYRFAKTLIDAKAGVTFANTVSNTNGIAGFMTPDEMVIMKEINDRLLSNPMTDYEPYVRPEGAYLVGETLDIDSNITEINKLILFPNIVNQSFKLSKEISSAIIYNLKGQEFLKFKRNTISFDVSMLHEGIYLLKALGKDGKLHIFKFIKQK